MEPQCAAAEFSLSPQAADRARARSARTSLSASRPVSGAFAVAAKSRPVEGPAKASEKVTGRTLRRAVRCYSSSRQPGQSTEAGSDPRVSRKARGPAAPALGFGRHCVKAVSSAGADDGSGATAV